MSKLVVLEGWINQKDKNRELKEVYVVLTKSDLKVYKSQMAYKQRPNETLKDLNLSESYNILPMSFDNQFTFSIFKKGEKAIDRLYLHASTKADYDFWLSQIESVLNLKDKESDTPCVNGDNSIVISKNNIEQVEKPPTPKPTYVIRTNLSPVVDKKSTDSSDSKDKEEKYSKLEADFQKDKKIIENLIIDNNKLKKDLTNCEKDLSKLNETIAKLSADKESHVKNNLQTETKLQKANDEMKKLKTEKQIITDKKMCLEKEIELLKNSGKETKSTDQTKLNQMITALSSKLQSSSIDLSSYMFCIDNLIDKSPTSSIFESLLKQQLVNLIHRCQIDLNSNVTLINYLTVNIDLSQDFIVQFLSKLLLSLSNSINKSAISKSDLDPNVIAIIKSVVTMTKPAQKMDSQLNLHQTLMEIAYLLSKKMNFKSQISNGVSNDSCKDIDNRFTNFLKSYEFDTTRKIFLIELGEQLKEAIQSKSEIKERKQNSVEKSNSILNSYIDKKWNETLKKLEQKDQEINDLYITVQQMSGRILFLENETDNSKSNLSYDEIINTYSMNAENLCLTCQTKAVDLLEIPIIKQIDKLVSDFKSYWKTLSNNQLILNSKQQFNSSLRELYEKTTQSTQEFENLMKQLSEITHRSIENPSLSKSSSTPNDQ